MQTGIIMRSRSLPVFFTFFTYFELAALVCLVAGLNAYAPAVDARTIAPQQTRSAEELANILYPQEEANKNSEKPRTRSLRGIAGVRKGNRAHQTNEATSKAGTQNHSRPTFSMAINFQMGSAVLKPESIHLIDTIARMLTLDQMRGKGIVIEGHTDSSGSHEANLALSIKRATAVGQYLMQKHNIDASRIRIDGKGEAQLLDRLNTTSAVNRRVQIYPL